MATPMTLQDVVDLVTKAVDRDDITPNYVDFINRAIRDISVLHSFDQMGESVTITILLGQQIVALPSNFKEFQSGRFPAYVSIGGAPQIPVPVYLKEEISRIQTVFMPQYYLIFTSDSPGFQIGLLPGQVTTAAWVILLYYYAYPDPLIAPTDTSQMLTFYPNLIISRALSLIFQSINDPVYEEHEKSFQLQMKGFSDADTDIKQPERSN